MKECVRFGIIGAGTIAHFHAEAIQKAGRAALSAVYSEPAETALRFAEKYGIKAFTDFDAFLKSDEFDAVSIATPTGTHARMAVPAAMAGKHILCEKPLDINTERADAIIAAAKENGVVLSPVFQMRFGDAIMALKERIDAGRFGRILFVRVSVKWYRSQEYYDSGLWRGTWELDGGGCLMNQSIHGVDLMIHLAGRPLEVYGYTSTRTHSRIEVEDNAAAVVTFAGGAFGVIESSTSCNPGFPLTIEISGENGTAVWGGDSILRWDFADKDPRDAEVLKQMKGESGSSGASDPKAINCEGHRRQIADMVGAILDKRPTLIAGDQGRIPIELITGIYTSMRTKHPYFFS